MNIFFYLIGRLIVLKIEKNLEGKNLEFVLSGKLDTNTSPDLEKEVKANIEGIENLEFDFKDLLYISSAGLRVLLLAQKIMSNQGSMVIRNCSDIIMEIFEVTGFIDILTVE